jgi:hypothetical protein
MHYSLRRFCALSALALLIGGCANASGSGAVPASAYERESSTANSLDAILDSAPPATGGHVEIRKLPTRPNANAPAILINFLTDGPNQGGVPCINCVAGASTSDNIGLTGPSSYVLSNFTWQYGVSFTDISYKGKCKLAFAITAGSKTIDSFSATLDLKSSGGFVLYAIARARPKYSGAATLTGKVTCGKESPSLQVPLQFE